MHHSLRLYSRHRGLILKYYMFQAKWTKIPLVGKLVRWVANRFGENVERGYLLTANEAEAIVDCSVKLALGPCTCRAMFKNCNNPVNTEIMVGFTQDVFIEERPHDYREITRQEAKEVLLLSASNRLHFGFPYDINRKLSLESSTATSYRPTLLPGKNMLLRTNVTYLVLPVIRECRQKGLIHTIMKFQKNFYAMCNCCACCCVPLRLSKKYGIGNALTKHADIVGEFRKHLVSPDLA